MNLSGTENITQRIVQELSVPAEALLEVKQPYVLIRKEDLLPVCSYLFKSKGLYFDFLNCITCVDNGSEKGTIDLIYHVSSIPLEHSLILKIVVNRDAEEVSSLASVWKSADWHEREIFDLFGVSFAGHPDLRRILLPADWEGHPLRKDYQEQETYHGIKVKYE